MTVLVSAIVPTFNRGHTLGRALTSALGQTRVPDQIVVVDDASTDATPEVLGRFPTVQAIRLDRNGGAARARNHAARLARGEFLAFLDSDDVWVTHKLERQLELMLAPGAPDLLCCGITVREWNGRVAYYGFESSPPRGGWTLEHLQTYPFSTSTWLIRRSAFLEVGGFDETLPNSEDLDFLARFSRRHEIGVALEPLVVKLNQSTGLNQEYDKTVASTRELLQRHRDLWDLAPVAAARTYHRLANIYAAAGQMASAREALRDAVRRQPTDARHWFRLILAHFGASAYRDLPALIRRMR